MKGKIFQKLKNFEISRKKNLREYYFREHHLILYRGLLPSVFPAMKIRLPFMQNHVEMSAIAAVVL